MSRVRGPSCSCSPASLSPSGSHAATPRPAPRSPSAVPRHLRHRLPPSVNRAPRRRSVAGHWRWRCSSAPPGRSVTSSTATACTRSGGSARPQRSAASGSSSVRGVAGLCGWSCQACCLPARGSSPATLPHAGIDEFDVGTRHFWVSPSGRVALPEAEEQLVAGEIEVTLYSAPPEAKHAFRLGRPRRDRHRRRR